MKRLAKLSTQVLMTYLCGLMKQMELKSKVSKIIMFLPISILSFNLRKHLIIQMEVTLAHRHYICLIKLLHCKKWLASIPILTLFSVVILMPVLKSSLHSNSIPVKLNSNSSRKSAWTSQTSICLLMEFILSKELLHKNPYLLSE